MVDAITSTAFVHDKSRLDEYPEMLHDREPAEFRDPGGELACRRRRAPELIQQSPSPRAGQRTPDVGLGGGPIG
jgi:hypothetical protein